MNKGLSQEQRKRIEENRKKALERLKLRRGEQPVTVAKPDVAAYKERAAASRTIENTAKEIPTLPRKDLTQEQKKRIEQNRQRALDLQKELQKHRRDASKQDNSKLPVTEMDRKRFKAEQSRPSIQKKDYIEYDFSTMKDSRGGFLGEEDKYGLQVPEEESETLKEWKEKQKQDHIVKDLAPPLDLENAPKCFECGSIELDPNLFTNFGARVCRQCKREKQEKYALLTKTECREDYLLTDPELRDTGLLRRIEKPNPHGFSRMQLFLRYQVEEFAWKKWGSAEGLDSEWERRERVRLERKEKKYHEKMKEMRKKTRAEEYTRKLRNGQSLGDRHEHSWSAPMAVGDNERMVKRRCVDCGIETEEIII